MAKYVVNSRLSFARTFILAEKSRLRSSPLLQAAERQAVKKPPFVQKNTFLQSISFVVSQAIF